MNQPSYPPFLATEIPDLPKDQCLFQVIPAPYEQTVSYGSGTALGPAAILAASSQLEAYDGISCPCEHGIYTREQATSLEAIGQAVTEVSGAGQIPIVLGGEHTVSTAAIAALHKQGKRFGVIHFDAHGDLRDHYQGNPMSHACVMRRALDLGLPIFQIGVRALSRDEAKLRRELTIPHLDAAEIAKKGIRTELVSEYFPDMDTVYVTFDVDCLDPGIMPATGTPEPGGLSWWQAMDCLQQITASCRIIGFDVVELAPIKGVHAPDFLAARLIYNLMGMISRSHLQD